MRVLFLFLLVAISTSLFGQREDRIAYIEKYKDLAIDEMERAGVPASIKLAQGLLESDAGKSYLARRANNHFGMKCGPAWKGKTVYRKDDDVDDRGKLIESCFRAYKNARESYVAHSEFLRDPRKAYRYGFLFDLNPYDYKSWAIGLKKAGYATSATYAEKLIAVIESYDLQQYDRQSVEEVIADEPSPKPQEEQIGIVYNNDVKLIYAQPGDNPQDIATMTDVSLSCLLKFNDDISSANTRLRDGQPIYLQKKRNNWRGKEKYHYVKSGQTIKEISDMYAVKEDKLRAKNRIAPDFEPAAGEQIRIRGRLSRHKRVKSLSKTDKSRLENKALPPPPIADENEPTNEDIGFGDDGFDEEGELTPDVPGDDGRPVLTDEDEFGGSREYPSDIIVIEPEDLDPTYEPSYPDRNNGNGQPPVVQDAPYYPPSTPTYPNTYPETVPVKPAPAPTTTTTTSNYPPTNPTPAPQPAGMQYHTVVAGDTLWNISKRYNLTVTQLQSMNGLSNNVIRKGQQLRVR